MLSREEASDAETEAPITARKIPEGLLSHDDITAVSSGALVNPRSVPEGMLSRESDSDSESITLQSANGVLAFTEAAAPCVVLEGVLSRDDSNDADFSSSTAGREVPEGLLSREESLPSSRPSQFNWFQQWYPVASLDALDPSRPHAFTLLGQELVLWRDGSGRWRAFKDACPHRLAPLSEGRIEADGSLMCAYHGWRFDGSGACTALPYCKPDDPALRSPRSCAVSYPSLELGGLLWVWGEGGPAAAAAAAAKQPPLPPEVQADGRAAPGVNLMGWSHRDLPYGHTFFVENVVDPAHVPVSHHNIAGNRYKDPKPFQLRLSRPVSPEEGFKVINPDPYRADLQEASTEFVPPGYVRIEQLGKNGSRTVLALFSTPIKPGWCRLVGQQMMVEPAGSNARARSAVGFVGASLPRWLGHTLGALFINQDMVFLHQQERLVTRQLLERAQRRSQRAAHPVAGGSGQVASMAGIMPTYFMPGNTDTGVNAWRTWLARHGGGDVSYAPGTPPLLSSQVDRAVLFDTWNSHTRHCTICLAALKRLRAARAVAGAVGLAAMAMAFGGVVTKAAAAAAASAATAATATAAYGSSPPVAAGGVAVVLQSAGWLAGSWEGLALLALAVLAAGVALVSSKIEEMMHKVEYSHADNH